MEVAPPSDFNLPRGDGRFTKPSSSAFLDSLVPNHILESRVYRKLGSNLSVAADPGVLHFGGFEIGACLHRTLRLVNISSDVSNVHIIPPQSKHFTVRYRKANRLPPGLALTLNLQFIADEWRYYYDCIRVHCKGDETLLVPLHAYPAMDLMHFPSHVSLSDVPLGQRALHILPVRCTWPLDFEFSIVCSQPHKDFEISPTSGVVPGGGLVEVTVTYTPSSYGTAQTRLELLISELRATPRLCVFTGTCFPRLTAAKERQEDVPVSPTRRPQGGQKLSYGVSRKKRHLQSLQQNASQVTEFQSLRFPLSLSSPQAVATVLNQQPGKLRVRDLRQGRAGSDKKLKTRQEKETQFQQVILQSVAEEEANQLRWHVHLGHDPISAKHRHIIMEDRRSAAAEYQVMRGCPDLAADNRREAAPVGCRRVLRRADECPRTQPQFDLYLNDLWANRSRALRRLQQGARTVLVRGRVDGRLKKLLQRLRAEGEEDATCDCGHEEEETAPLSAPQLYEFPPYPAEPDGSPLQDFVSLPPRPAAAPLRHRLSFQDLKVPQHFRLMAYQLVRSPRGSTLYPPCHLVRALRRGAEDELMPEVPLPPDAPGLPFCWALSIRSQDESEGDQSLLLRPPETLLSPQNFHCIHVFNPTPGLVAFKRPLSYSEIDLEYHLCPLPKYPDQQEGPGGSCKKEIIRGLVSWKKFPTAPLSAPLPAANGCRPRWCDPFNVDLLPVSAPPALGILPAEDKENIVPRDGEDADLKVWLTPDMLRAEFSALQSSTPPNTQAAAGCFAKLHVPVKGNSLAEKVQVNLEELKRLSVCPWLILD